jgi:hypothetical protein
VVGDGMISIAELVGGSIASLSNQQGNILGLSKTTLTVPVGQVLPFYDIALEKIQVLSTVPLIEPESALLYLKIAPFYALFGFINNHFQLLHTFQEDVLSEGVKSSFGVTLNARSAVAGDVYQVTLGTWEALITVTSQQILLHKVRSFA